MRQILWKKAALTLVSLLAAGVLCGLFWEYVSPLLISGSVSDPLDLLAYLAGGLAVLPLLRLDRARRRP